MTPRSIGGGGGGGGGGGSKLDENRETAAIG